MASLISNIIAAKKEMAPLIKDEVAKIKSDRGASFEYDYISLDRLLEIAVPPLLEHGVLLSQDVFTKSDDPSFMGVKTYLVNAEDGEEWASSTLYFRAEADPKKNGANITYYRRYQIAPLLGLAAATDTDAGAERVTPVRAQEQGNTQREPLASTGKSPIQEQDFGMGRKKPAKSAPVDPSHPAAFYQNDVPHPIKEDLNFREVIRQLREDDDLNPPMSTTPAEGRKLSMYAYLAMLIDEKTEKGGHNDVLAFLLGRPVDKEHPPSDRHRRLVNAVKDDDTYAFAGYSVEEIHAAVQMIKEELNA